MLEAVRRSRLLKRRSAVASWTALAVVAAGLTYYAISAEGQHVLKTELHDGGVWVTNQDQALIGRQNKPVSQLDATVPSSDFADVLQEGAAVVAVDGGSNTLTPISPTLGVALPESAVAAAGPATMGGGSVAVVKPETGQVWATRVDPGVGVSSLAELDGESEPLFKLAPDAMVAASADGEVIAAAPGQDSVTVLKPASAGFGKPAREALDASATGGLAGVSVVGDTPVVLDAQHNVILPSATASVGAPQEPTRLQQPGPRATSVLVATASGLSSVDLADGATHVLAEAQGDPAAPVRLGSCDWGVWANGNQARVAMVCDGKDPVVSAPFGLSPGAQLVFRVNRSNLLLNDVKNGGVWNVDGANPQQISDWESLQANQEPDDSDAADEQAPQVKQHPDARDDELGARSGFTTVLHVLDNDLVSGGGVLAITGISGLENEAGVTVQPSPDRQSVLLTLADNISRDLSFDYTVDDGTGGDKSTDTARVQVHVRTNGDPVAPVRPEGWDDQPQTVYPVTAGGTLEVSVLPEWRDPEFGDRVTLDDVAADQGVTTTITPEGLLRIQVPQSGGPDRVTYRVSTGGPPAEGSVRLNVLQPGSLKPVAPQAEADVAAGQVGAAIKVSPLDNDVPGADPTDPQAQLELAGRVQPRQGLRVRTDLETGEVTVTARKPGAYSLTYAAGFGAASRSTGEIRVVVDPASDQADAPIASPDVTTIRGMAPVVVDVLANDYDAQGRLLAVQSARPVKDDSALQVAVLDGRWLRISATTTDLTPNPQAVQYVVSNGSATATGTVSVTQKQPLPSSQNSPIPEDDDAVVRVGDTVAVPVLSNDTSPSGDPLGLVVPTTTGVRGELSVEPAVGKAYVTGNRVRYVAPDQVDGPQTVEVQYVVENTADRTASPAAGIVRVRINPEPSDVNPNTPPTPRSIEARVVAGDTVSLRLPANGNDPDGDSVSILGVTQGPQHGRILSVGAGAMVYQSFPGAPGFDQFTYLVTDRYGATAEGDVRVVVTDTGAAQAPVAVPDVITADVGRKVDVDVLGNDLRTPGTALTITSLDGAPDDVDLVSPSGPIRLTSSADTHRPVTFSYRVSNGLDESVGTVTVKSVKGFDNPPQVPDSFARPEAGSATVSVDVLARASDVDGPVSALEIESVGQPAAKIKGGKVVLPVLDLAQAVPIRVVDADGGATAAVVYVPARPQGAPYLKSGASVHVGVGKAQEVPLSDLVVDPEGDAVVLTVADAITAGPQGGLTVTAPNPDTLRVAAGPLAGPGVITFQVSDRAQLSDPDAHVVTLSVPVQIGDGSPIISCPGDPLPVIEGGPARTFDVGSLCHVWTPDPADATSVAFTAAWAPGQQPADVALTPDESGFKLRAGVSSRGQTGTVDVGAEGTGSSGSLLVEVVPAGPPTLSPIELETEADASVSVDVASYATSPFGSDAKFAVTQVAQTAGPGGPAPGREGTRLTFTPKEFGTYTYQVTLSDDGGKAGSARPTATAQITLSVVDKPEAPTGLSWDGVKQDGKVQLSWAQPEANGGAIASYTVYYQGPSSGTQQCPAPRCVITGLENGDPYTFQVSATNAYGESDKSTAVRGTADRVPDAVTGLAVVLQHDHQVTLSWAAPSTAASYSAITGYFVSWPGAGKVFKVAGGQTTFATPQTLANDQDVAFTVWAENAAGPSPSKASVTGRGAGKPETPTMNDPQTTNRAGNDNKAVTISWGAVAANGPDPVSYTVTRTGGGAPKTVCEWVQATSCADDLANDGTTYTYQVQARNGEATAARETNPTLHVSSLSAPVSVEAAATPDNVTIDQFVATGQDGKAKVTFDAGPSHGAKNTVECDPNCGTLGTNQLSTSGQGNLQATVSGYSNGDSATIRLRTCNGSSSNAQTGDSCSAWVSATTITFGPIPKPSLDVSKDGQCINWSYSGNANGKAVQVQLTMNGQTIRNQTSGRKTYADSGRECPGYAQTGNFTVTASDTANAPGQSSARSSQSESGSARTDDPPPMPPTLTNYIVVRGGCCGAPGQVGVAWDTTYPAGSSGGSCHWTRDGAEFTDERSCPGNGRASRQFYDQPAGQHTYCGYVRMPDNSRSNVPCQSVTVTY